MQNDMPITKKINKAFSRMASTIAKSPASIPRWSVLFLGAIPAYIGYSYFTKKNEADASAEGLHPPHFPWDWKHPFSSYDAASLRRGFQVYRQVCAACHGMRFLSFRHFKDIFHTEEELKEIAADYTVKDGPNDKGDMFDRTAKISDYIPDPYPNEILARLANNGALPPDLSLIVSAREGGADYIYSLLLGFTEPPAGVKVGPGMHFNRFFPGGQIGMARAIYDDVVEYEDGTPATASQIAKDVVHFLAFASQPELDNTKKMALRALGVFALTLGSIFYLKRYYWSYLKTKRYVFKRPPSLD